MRSAAVLLGALSTLGAAFEYLVEVGGPEGLVFLPDRLWANEGDVINFSINKNHSVAQSSFDNPCNPINDNAIFSGFGSSKFSITINDTKPLWIYCSQASHCSQGMVMAINPTQMNNLDKYRENAKGKGPSVSPSHVGGGIASGSNTGSGSGSSGGGYYSDSDSISMASATGSSGSGGYGGYGSSSSMMMATGTGSSGAAATGAPSNASTPTSGTPTSAAPTSASSTAAKGAAAAMDARAMGLLSGGVAAIVAAALL